MQSKARFVRIHNAQAAGGDIYTHGSLLRSSQEDICMHVCIFRYRTAMKSCHVLVQDFAKKEEKSVLGIRIHHMQRAEMH